MSMPEEQVLIDKGQAAMWPETDIVLWWRNQQGNVGAVPFPVDNADDQTTPSTTQSLWLSSGTNQPEAAWRFMDFLSRQGVTTAGLDVNSLPARRSVAEATGYWDELDEELAETMRYALEHSYILRGRASYNKARANLGIMRRQGLLRADVPYIAGILADRQNKRDRAAGQYRRALELDAAHRPSWDQLIHHKALDPDERALFQKLWPGE